MKLESELIDLPRLHDGTPFFGIDAVHDSPKSEWVILKGSGELFLVDFDEQSVSSVAKLDESAFDRAKEAVIHVSGDGRFAVVANRYGIKGAVVDLSTGRTTMTLKRDEYRVENCAFPLAFVKRNDRWLLAHATAWNRLDVSDALTGDLLTGRESPKTEEGRPRPPHYLDYFHSALLPSPDYSWIADSGWAWHPVGVVRAWSVDRWLAKNVWESEDGPTAKDLCAQDDWDQPMCWVDNRTLAAWSEDSVDNTDQLVLGFFNVESGERIRRLAVPKGGRMFVEDDRLFVEIRNWTGITVWDIESGDQLLEDRSVHAIRYHRGAKQFWGYRMGATHVISRLCDDG